MRISVSPSDPGYIGTGVGIEVRLDGIARSDVVTADEEQRYIIKWRRDEKGRLVLNAARDAVEIDRLEGDVAIVLPPHLTPELIATIQANQAKR